MDPMMDWWRRAYVERRQATSFRFMAEAASSLPLLRTGGDITLEDVFAGAQIRLLAIRADQQLEEWSP